MSTEHLRQDVATASTCENTCRAVSDPLATLSVVVSSCRDSEGCNRFRTVADAGSSPDSRASTTTA